jgi:hypothetical protein
MCLHFFYGHIKGLIGINRTCEALKPNSSGAWLYIFNMRLDVDM